MHVKQIRTIVDSGKNDEAHEALDQLLALGPNNTEALKLRAKLLEYEGRFADEAKVWERILTIDHEDEDAASFMLRKQLEDREHYYFTDDVAGGGRRFMAYPRRLVNLAALGLAGCVAFLLSSRLSLQLPVLADPVVMLGLFTLLVVLPWISIMTSYLTSVRHVTIETKSITISTRLKAITMAWADIEKVCVARSLSDAGNTLYLVLIPKDRTSPTVELDLHQQSSSIRARAHLVREISKLFSSPEYATRDSLGIDRRGKLTSF